MRGEDWSVIDLTADPVRGEPSAARTLGNASRQEARRWEAPLQQLRTLGGEGGAMEMEGDFATTARERLAAHPTDATPLAKGRAEAASALLAYASQLEEARRQSQTALQRGTQAKRNRDMAERQLKQVQAQLRAICSQTYYGPAYYAAVQRFNMLKAQEARLISAWEQAESQRMAARQQAVAAGERATQQERVAAEKVIAAIPTRGGSRGSRGNGGGSSGRSRTPAVAGGSATAGRAAATGTRPPGAARNFDQKREGRWGDSSRRRDLRPWGPQEGRAVAPSRRPSPGHQPTGTRASENLRGPRADARRDNRGGSSENRTADVAARHGFRVEQRPAVPADVVAAGRVARRKEPDYLIEGRYFDNKMVTRDLPVTTIRDRIGKAINGGQAEGVILDMTRSRATPDQVVDILRATYPPGSPLNGEVWVRRGNDMFPIWP